MAVPCNALQQYGVELLRETEGVSKAAEVRWEDICK